MAIVLTSSWWKWNKIDTKIMKSEKNSTHLLQILGTSHNKLIIVRVDEKMFVKKMCLLKWLHIYCVNFNIFWVVLVSYYCYSCDITRFDLVLHSCDLPPPFLLVFSLHLGSQPFSPSYFFIFTWLLHKCTDIFYFEDVYHKTIKYVDHKQCSMATWCFN